jgi:hypothetical protein
MIKRLTIAPALATPIPSAAIGADKIEKRTEEWDFPPTRHRGNYRPRRRRYHDVYQPGTWDSVDVYQPGGWDWPIRKKIIDIGWRVMITCLKVALIGALTIIAFGASWLIVTVLTL